jgi:carboxypeptidase family protein
MSLSKRSLGWLALSLAASLGAGGRASAVCLEPKPKVCNAYFKSDAVFTAVVLDEKAVREAGELEGRLYSLMVQHRYKGQLGETVEVYTENSSSGLALVRGHEYLLFAKRAGERLEIADDCAGNSGPTLDSASRINELSGTVRWRTAIEGRVSTRPKSKPVAGAKFEITGEGRTYSAETDASGAFRVEVPPGTYSLAPVTPGVSVSDVSVDDPKRLVLEPGECGQVQFVSGAAKPPAK